MAPWADQTRVLIYKNSAWVDITEFVRFTRVPLGVTTGRSTELEGIAPGRLTLGIDNAGGQFTPGSASATLELTLGMPIRLIEQVGYKSFPLFYGALQLPETAESLEGVDNLVVITAVDGKELLDNGRTFVSTLAEHILASPTLVHYYPLSEDRAPFRDIVGDGYPLATILNSGSLAGTGTMAPSYTPNGGPTAPGDDLHGLLFSPEMSTGGGFGFPTFASGYQILNSNTNDRVSPTTQVAAGQLLTFVLWVSLTDSDDAQSILSCDLRDAGFTQMSTIFITRIMNWAPTFGALAGLLDASLNNLSGGTLAGDVTTILPLRNTGGSVLPLGIQIGYTPNSLKLWAGRDEFIATAPTGAAINPQIIGALQLGPMGGSVSHCQIHVGDFTHDDFVAQYEMGRQGLAGQRTDERVATILSYAGSPPADLDLGSTYMQSTNLGGRKPGELIDEATTTEQGRFFFNGEGRAQFHSRVRVYNV